MGLLIMMNHKIVIAGCGLSGMISALNFAAYNIPVIIIENNNVNDLQQFSDIRTTAFTYSSKKFFQDIKIWEEIETIAGSIDDIYVVDNKASEMIHFSPIILNFKDKMGYLVENSKLKEKLFSLVGANPLITLIDCANYNIKENTDNNCIISVQNEDIIEADLLIVCEGSKSAIKQLYFSNRLEKFYSQYAITFLVAHEKAHEGAAIEHFLGTGPFAILPLKDQNMSSVVWTVKQEMKDILLNMPKEEFMYLVQENFGQFLGCINLQSELAAFALKAISAKDYFNKRIVLVADSAHTIHPLAGQGLNQGIKDIQSLAEMILQYGINKVALSKYQAQRKMDNEIMLQATDLINTIFSNHSKILHNVRQLGFKIINDTPLLKKKLINYAMGAR